MNEIRSFSGEYAWLSNFWPAEVAVSWGTFPSVEHAYQAAKDPGGIPPDFNAMTAGQAKRWGRRQADLRPNWDVLKVSVMRLCIAAKFKRGSELSSLLLSTGDSLLVEGNGWGDSFWGVDMKTDKGENYLGRILMARREQLRTTYVRE